MAKATRVVIVCDFHDDGTEAVETVAFQAGRARYELDVCQEHLDELTGAARRVRSTRRSSKQSKPSKSSRTKKRTRSSRASTSDLNNAIREWARASGYSVSDRGRIPADVIAAYNGV
jgi:hypothetical protein